MKKFRKVISRTLEERHNQEFYYFHGDSPGGGSPLGFAILRTFFTTAKELVSVFSFRWIFATDNHKRSPLMKDILTNP